MGDNKTTDSPHDKRLRELFHNKKAFVSLLKDCVREPWIDDLDIDSLQRKDTGFMTTDFEKREVDVLWEGTIDNGKDRVMFYALNENQSRVDYRMSYRLLIYMTEILRDYYNQSDPKERKRKGFKFPVVVPIIFYTGRKKWSVSRHLKDMFAGYKRFGDSVLNFSYAIVDVKGYDENSVQDFGSNLLKMMVLLEKSRNFDEIVETVKKHKGEIQELDEEEQRVFNIALDLFDQIYGKNQSYKLREIVYKENAGEVDVMLADVLANAKNLEKKIRREGKEEKAIEMATKMLLKDKPMDEIIEFTGLSEGKIRGIEKTLK